MATTTFKNSTINSLKIRKNTPEEIILINCLIGDFLYEEAKSTNGRNKLTLNGNFGSCSLRLQSPCNIIFGIEFFCNEINIDTTNSNAYDNSNIGTYIINGYVNEIINDINIKSDARLILPKDSLSPSKNINIGNLQSHSQITVVLQGDFNIPGNILNSSKLILEECTLSNLIIPNDESIPVTLELFPKYSEIPLVTSKIIINKNTTLSGAREQFNKCISPNSEYVFDGYIEDVNILNNGSGTQIIPMPDEPGEYVMSAYIIKNTIHESQIGNPKLFSK